jgi:glyoxylase-like metal-dependent hydrolase (beta-lactamase superfamily II)
MQGENSGYHHFKLGDITVTALNDAVFAASTDVLTGVSPEDAEAMLSATHRKLPPHITINAFLIRTGSNIALVDTGISDLWGPVGGGVARNMAALGVAPGDVDTVLMTHLHGDHVGALADASGAATFPNAELVVGETEAKYWADPAVEATAPERLKESIALARRMIAPYANRTRRAGPGEVLPGIHLHPLPGHTPGHSGYLVQSGREALLIWGDVVHLPGLQFARPQIGVMYDTDGAMAAETRTRAMDMAATDGLRVAGMHLDFPAFAHVARAGDGFVAVPEVWMPG